MPSDAVTVNFLIVGTQKGGTTALAAFLAQTPDICIAPAKEVHLFDDAGLVGSDWDSAPVRRRYAEAFPNHAGESLVGEATPIYMYLPFIAPAIHRYNPDMKLIVLLREPVDRAVSQYLHARRHRHEPLPLVAALWREKSRLRRDRDDLDGDSSLRWHSYVDRGRYADQLRNLMKYFSREQLLVLRSEDLVRQHDETLRRVLRFLGAATPDRLPASEKIHASSGSCWQPRFARRWMARQCLASTLELESLLGWDLADWRTLAETGA